MANSTQLTTVTFNSVLTVLATSVNCTLSRNTIEIAGLGSSFVDNVFGTARVSGSIEVLFDKSDHAAFTANTSGAAAAAAMTILWNTGETWSGNAIINEVSVTAGLDDVVKATVSFTGTGTWTV